MSESLEQAKSLLFHKSDVDESAIDKVMSKLLSSTVDDADLYFQNASYESWYLEDSQVKSGSFSIDRGVGIRAVSEDKTGYAYCDDILLPSLLKAADAAKSIVHAGQTKQALVEASRSVKPQYADINPIETTSKQAKIDLLKAIDEEVRRMDPRVIQVNASLSASYEAIIVAGMNYHLLADIRPLISIHVSVVVEDKNGRRESARSGGADDLALMN